jgi:hypothetical protein
MDLDFAKEYSRKSDLELMLIWRDQNDLVPIARSALQAELSRRKLTADSLQSGPVFVKSKQRREIENAVEVNSKQLLFPQICPRCLAPTTAHVRISPGGDFWSIWFPVVAFSRYLFSRHRVPFCAKCASSVHFRRWTIRLSFFAIILFCLMLRADGITGVSSSFFAVLIFGIAWGIWKLLGIDKRWPAEGIEIISAPNDSSVRLLFKQPQYQTEFVKLNQINGAI